MPSPWHLPGPKRFLDGISEHLFQGRCMAIRRPRVVPPGWDGALEEAIYQTQYGVCRVTPEDPHFEDPWRLIWYDFLGMDSSIPSGGQEFLEGCRKSVEGLDHRVILAVCEEEDAFQAWTETVGRLECIQGIAKARDRVLVLVEGIGPFKHGVKRTSNGLSIRSWEWPFQPMDMLLWSHINRDPALNLMDELAVRLGSTLAGYDPELGALLARQDLPTLLNPQAILAGYADSQGWKHDTARDPWLGTEGLVGGKRQPHAAWEVVTKVEEPEWTRRSWSCQVSVILPEIEEQRRAFINRHKAELPLPWIDHQNRNICDPYDCEVGHLFAMSIAKPPSQRLTLGPTGREWIRGLREARNRLSHLEMLTLDQIRSIASKRA